MTTAVKKTEQLQRVTLNSALLIPSEYNPNEMGDREFNLLYENIEEMGITDPILVRPSKTKIGSYDIVGGHHRWEVAKLIGIEDIPCTVITDPDFDDDRMKFQMVRHNIIHGKMNPKKFLNLYESLDGKYNEEISAELFGFANEDEFRKLVKATGKALPKEMQQTFADATKEIKTIDDLAGVLNKLFTTYGDTVPYGYMIFDYGTQEHIWLRMKKNQKTYFNALADLCRANNRSIDAGISALLQLIAQSEEGSPVAELFSSLLEDHPEITLAGVPDEKMPTEDLIASFAEKL